MTPPDSDAVNEHAHLEEVLRNGEGEMRDDGRRWSYPCFARLHRKCAGGSCACECHIGPFIPLPLAQRILAALEQWARVEGMTGNMQAHAKIEALAAELRERIPK